jgi:uncharacterized integral membrane protein
VEREHIEIGGMDYGSDVPTPETRWICLFVAVILALAVALLWVQPSRTDELFAWTIKPPLTPLLMGSAYAAGAFFFAVGFVTRRWHRIGPPFVGIAVFATMMLAATLIHWDKFNHGDAPTTAAIAFYLWVGVYILSPGLVAFVWFRNRSVDRGVPEPRDVVLPTGFRIGGAILGVVLVTVGIIGFAAPTLMIDRWPWALTPLTARIIACYAIEGGLIALLLSRDSRWTAWRAITGAAVIGSTLLLIGVLRAWSDLETDNALTWLLVIGLSTTVVAGTATLVLFQRLLNAGR